MKDSFLLFAGEDFCPKGGWKDFKGHFKSFSDAINFFHTIENKLDWAEIVRINSGLVELVWEIENKKEKHYIFLSRL